MWAFPPELICPFSGSESDVEDARVKTLAEHAGLELTPASQCHETRTKRKEEDLRP